MAYLYMIAEGSFSLKCLEDIALEIFDSVVVAWDPVQKSVYRPSLQGHHCVVPSLWRLHRRLGSRRTNVHRAKSKREIDQVRIHEDAESNST